MTRQPLFRFALAGLVVGVAPLAAQTASEPNFILSINGGVTTGAHLWAIPRQLVVGGFAGGPGGYDTLALGRRTAPGIVATVLATLHRSPHVGYVAEIGYFGVASEGRCTVIGLVPDGEQKTQQACSAVQGQTYRTSVVGFQGGLTYRLLPRGAASPYVRATGGLGVVGNSFIETSSLIVAPSTCGGACTWTLLHAPERSSLTYVATLAAGLVWRAGEGYQVRFEARDFMAGLPVVRDSTGAGAPNPFPTARVGTRLRHTYMFTVGLDVVLERRHRRRY